MLNEMKDVISLTIGEPDFTTPEPITRAAIASLEAETHYSANGGMIELRQLIASDLEARLGLSCDPRTEIVVTVGASEALDASLRAICQPATRSSTTSRASWPTRRASAGGRHAGGGVHHRATNFELTPAMVEAAVTPAPGHLPGLSEQPDRGRAAPRRAGRDRRGRTAQRPAGHQRRDLRALVYGDHEHVAIASLPGMRERTIHIGGFSKSYAMTGWRIGYVCAPAGLMAGIAKIHQYGIMCAPTPAQYAAIEAVRSGEPFVQSMHEEYGGAGS